MLWRGRRQSDNIEDDRSDSGGGGGFGGGDPGQFRIPIGGSGGGMSISSLIIFAVIALIAWGVFGINPLQLLNGGDIGGGQITSNSPRL